MKDSGEQHADWLAEIDQARALPALQDATRLPQVGLDDQLGWHIAPAAYVDCQ